MFRYCLFGVLNETETMHSLLGILVEAHSLIWLNFDQCLQKTPHHLVLSFERIDGIMKCINLGKTKYDVNEGLRREMHGPLVQVSR